MEICPFFKIGISLAVLGFEIEQNRTVQTRDVTKMSDKYYKNLFHTFLKVSIFSFCRSIHFLSLRNNLFYRRISVSGRQNQRSQGLDGIFEELILNFFAMRR
ncbi:hypothetical protein CAEBREN_15329 [Caenorhabditis brenneri]|uniref:Uncharacterized protein n=1 Tax=Caenorhabditis brenneri TaxID=135651 RepID=G0MNK4_CAEBE|nr:hypothetical protein CAEBREN_15329 [Caenorhabditis brenneri]